MSETEKDVIREYMSHNNFHVVHNCVYGQKEAIEAMHKIFPYFINISKLYGIDTFYIFSEHKMMIVGESKYYFTIEKDVIYHPVSFEPIIKNLSCVPIRESYFKNDSIGEIYNYFNKHILQKYYNYQLQ